MLNAKYGIEPKKLKEIFMDQPLGISMQSTHFLFNIFDEVVAHLISGGIQQKLYENHSKVQIEKFSKNSTKFDEEILNAFTIDDLSYGFVIWLISCGIAVWIFIAELFMKLMKLLRFEIENFVGIIFMMIFIQEHLINN